MSSDNVPLAKRRRLDGNSALQQPQQSYEHTVAYGSSRNLYGNVYHAPVSYYTDVPTVNSEANNTPTAERLIEALNFDEREDRLATIGTAHEETCQWLFEKDEYKAWRDPDKRSTHHGFFWIKGKPGTGKSTLMKCAYNRGLKEFTGDVIVSFFFNARGSKLQKSTEGMYRSLLCQLLEQMPPLAAKLPHRKCDRLQKPAWPIELLKDVLREALLLVESARLTCYVDALDECQDQDAREMVDFFDSLSTSAVASNVSVHVLLSSRHYPQIHISRCQQLTLEQQSDHSSDIVKYIEFKLQIGSSVMARDIRSTLLRKASGVFLWVVLVIQKLNEHKRRGLVHELKRRVDDIPRDLDTLFAEILQDGSSELPYTLSMLQLIVFANRPLKREELYHAVLYSEARDETTELIDVTQDDMEHFIINCSRGLAEMTKGMCPTVQLIHESVRNHLPDTGLKTLVPLSCDNLPAWCHENLKALCLGYAKKCALVLLRLPVDGQKEHLSDHFMDIIKLRRQTSTTYPFLDYALDGVITHALHAHCAGRLQHAYTRSFPLDIWVRLHNFLVPSHHLRLSQEARLLYILVIKGAFQLVELIVEDTSWRPDTGNLASNEQHRTVLGAATDRGDYKMLDKLLEVGMPPSSDAKDEQSCLSIAIGKGDVEICRRLMAAGANVNNMSTRYGASDLRLAIESGSIELVRVLLQHPQYARGLISSFEVDLKFAMRRYAESTCHFEELVPLIGEALERSNGGNLGAPSLTADTHAVYTAVVRAAYQRAKPPVMYQKLDQAIVDLDLLKSSLIAGDLDVIDLVLRARADIKPSLPEAPADPGHRDSKFTQLLLDQAENAIDAILEAIYPGFSEVSASDTFYQVKLPRAIYPAPNSPHANARDIRFARVLPLAVYYGHSWVPVLERLLDKTLDLSSRENYMDTALQSACYLRRTETLQTLLDWCNDSPLKRKSMPGLGRGLIHLVLRWSEAPEVEQITCSMLDVPANMFCQAHYHACGYFNTSDVFERTSCQRVLLAWGLERCRRDAVFARELGFIPTGDIDDQQRLERNLHRRRQPERHAASSRAMIRPERM
jgi:hypothetical protein